MRNAGFTLVELMITIAIMSIMLAVGLPSFQAMIASNRVTSATNAMVSALQLARFEAIKQHKPVTIRKNTKWQNGWIVFVDKDASHILNGDEKSFAVFDKLSANVTLVSNYANYVEYSEAGRVNVGGSFCFSVSTEYRKVVIAATGRVRVETPSSCS